jgi:hypothetical protein
LPGCADVLARDFLFISALISEDLPTFDFPENAISGLSFLGSTLVIPQTVSKLALLIIICSTSFLIHHFVEIADGKKGDVAISSIPF